jgi:hypothetical protein
VAKTNAKAEAMELAELAGEVADDTRRLIGQQLDLLRAEVRETVDQVVGAGASVAAGAGLLAAGGLLAVVAAAQMLHRATGLPTWACYGLAAGAAGAGGVALMQRGRQQLTQLRLLPKTAETLEENVTWVREQVTTAG